MKIRYKSFYLLISLIIILGVIFFILQQRDTQEELAEDLPLALGQNFVIGLTGYQLTEEMKDILQYIKPAGVVIYKRNYESFEQLKEFIKQIQIICQSYSQNDCFVMLDEEPGGASRLNLFSDAFLLGWPDWTVIEQGIIVLKDLGINVELAPLFDFPFNENAFIKNRVLMTSPEDLVEFNINFITLLSKYKILATLKHFPGLGIFQSDPHKEIPSSNINEKILKESIQLFKEGIDQNPGFVMTAHALYENMDKDNIATLSSVITTDILRNQLNFQGLIITDDLADMPLSKDTITDRANIAIEAIEAGHNLIMFSHRPQNTKEIFSLILDKVKEEPVLKEIILKNKDQIIQLKRNYLFK